MESIQNSAVGKSYVPFDYSPSSSTCSTSSSAVSTNSSSDSSAETSSLIPFPSITTGIQHLINKYNSDNGRLRRITLRGVKPAKYAVTPALLKKPSPVLNLEGTVKLHGIHIDLVFDLANVEDDELLATDPQPSLRTGTFRIQSRNVASIDEINDIFDVAKTLRKPDMQGPIFSLRDQFLAAFRKHQPDHAVDKTQHLILAGEWVGPGVQPSVALSQFPAKALVILNFNVNESWVPDLEPYAHINYNYVGIFNIYLGGVFRVAVKVDDPEPGFEEVKNLTLAVEAECPFAKAIGQQKLNGRVISGVGEGIVWRVASVSPQPQVSPRKQVPFDFRYWAKTKGLLHAEVDLTKLPVPFDPDAIAAAKAFAAAAVTEVRLQKKWVDMLQLFPAGFNASKTGKFMEVLYKDIEREEAEEMENRGVNRTEAKREVMALGKAWFRKNLEQGRLLVEGESEENGRESAIGCGNSGDVKDEMIEGESI